MNPLYAILLDSGFVTKKLTARLAHYPTADDIVAECARISAHAALQGHDLLRIVTRPIRSTIFARPFAMRCSAISTVPMRRGSFVSISSAMK